MFNRLKAKKCNVTSALSNGKFDGSPRKLSPPTRSSMHVTRTSRDEIFKTVPAMRDIGRVVEAVSIALKDPEGESYGLAGDQTFSLPKLTFDLAKCAW